MSKKTNLKRYSSPAPAFKLPSEEMLKEIVEKIDTFKDSIHSALIENIKSIAENFTDLVDSIEGTREDFETYKWAIVELGYPPHYSIDIPKLRRIAIDYRENGKDYVAEYIDEFMIDYFNGEISNIANGWENNSFLQDRIKLLRNVIMAHNLKMYHLSVVALITQLDGIIMKAFKIEGQSDGGIIKVLLKHLLVSEGTYYSFNKSVRKYYEDKVLSPFQYGKTIKSDMSRHAIAHGGTADFGKEDISIKVILLFDYLVDAINELSDEKREIGRKKVREYKQQRKNRGRA